MAKPGAAFTRFRRKTTEKSTAGSFAAMERAEGDVVLDLGLDADSALMTNVIDLADDDTASFEPIEAHPTLSGPDFSDAAYGAFFEGETTDLTDLADLADLAEPALDETALMDPVAEIEREPVALSPDEDADRVSVPVDVSDIPVIGGIVETAEAGKRGALAVMALLGRRMWREVKDEAGDWVNDAVNALDGALPGKDIRARIGRAWGRRNRAMDRYNSLARLQNRTAEQESEMREALAEARDAEHEIADLEAALAAQQIEEAEAALARSEEPAPLPDADLLDPFPLGASGGPTDPLPHDHPDAYNWIYASYAQDAAERRAAAGSEGAPETPAAEFGSSADPSVGPSGVARLVGSAGAPASPEPVTDLTPQQEAALVDAESRLVAQKAASQVLREVAAGELATAKRTPLIASALSHGDTIYLPGRDGRPVVSQIVGEPTMAANGDVLLQTVAARGGLTTRIISGVEDVMVRFLADPPQAKTEPESQSESRPASPADPPF